MPQGYVRALDLPQVIPVFPLGGAILLPRGQLPLNIFEPRYLNMVDDAMAGDRVIGMIQTRGGSRARPILSNVGCLGRITSYNETSDGRYLITLTGVCRFDLDMELEVDTPYRQALVSYENFAGDFTASTGERIDRAGLIASLKAYANVHGFQVDWASVEEAPTETIINVAAQICPFDTAAKQALLETVTLEDRAAALIALVEWDAASGDEQRPMQ